MNALLLTSLVALAAPQARDVAAPAPQLDGNWTVVCLEKDGQPVAEAKNMAVMFKDNTVTFQDKSGQSSKEVRSMRLQFGQNGTVQVTEAGADGKFQPVGAAPADAPADAKPSDPAAGGMKAGIYVLTQDYLALCIHNDAAKPNAGAAPADAAAIAKDPQQNQANAKSKCTVILKREAARGQ